FRTTATAITISRPQRQRTNWRDILNLQKSLYEERPTRGAATNPRRSAELSRRLRGCFAQSRNVQLAGIRERVLLWLADDARRQRRADATPKRAAGPARLSGHHRRAGIDAGDERVSNDREPRTRQQLLSQFRGLRSGVGA